MAEFDVSFPADFLSEILETDVEEICKEALREAAPIMKESMKKSARSVVMHDGESDMVNSIDAREPQKTADGDAFITNIGPTGSSDHYYYDKKSRKKRKYKVSNALKGIWKEYGIAGKQPATPFIANATHNAETAVIDKMQEVYRKETQDGSEQ